MSSSDTGSRKRLKDKKRKKGSVGELNLPNHLPAETARKKFVRDETTIHIQKDVHVGGNILSKLIFVTTFLLLGISLMYILNQSDILGGTNNDDSKTWLTNFLTFDDFWGNERQQHNDDIEPEEMSEYNYWNFLFPFLSFIQKTYEEPEHFEKDFAEEDEAPENLKMTKESETSNVDEEDDDQSNEEKSSDRNRSEDEEEEDEKKYHYNFRDNCDSSENDQNEDDDETRATNSFSASKSTSSFKFDTHKYSSEENDGEDELYNKDVDYDKGDSNEESDENDDDADDDDGGDNYDENDNNDDDEQENDEATSDDYMEDDENRTDENNESTPSDRIEADENSPDSAVKDLESDVDGLDHEPTNEDQTESSHVVEEPIADYISEDEDASNLDNKNETLQEYLETPSASESEDEHAPEGTSAHELEDSESYAGTSASEAIDSDIEPSATFDRYTSGYNKANITNEYDWRYKDDLDHADEDFDQGKLDTALEKYEKILQRGAESVRARYGLAKILDRKAEMSRSNKILAKAINAYEKVLNAANVPDLLFKTAAHRLNDRMRFKGEYGRAIGVQKMLIERFPDEVTHRNDLVVTLLMLNRMSEAEKNLEETLRKWTNDGMALVHYGFVLKLKGDLERAVNFLKRGIDTREPGTQDGRFYYHLGDALQKLKRNVEAMQVYEDGVLKRVFPSKYQRSLYNIDRLTARPWWSLNQSTYSSFFKNLETNWEVIRNEALQLLERGKDSSFQEEAEQLREIGDWKQFELFSRGVRSAQCDKVPFTCGMIEKFQPAAGCRRGQVKFSIMEPGTHVWPHCGPTNCRLRAHLGLVVPSNVSIRVADKTKTWEEGKIVIFDDSFEHEVWHNGTTYRLVLIVDVWHPELTEYERKTLSAI